jgi:hypothetical protein
MNIDEFIWQPMRMKVMHLIAGKQITPRKSRPTESPKIG